MIGPIQIKSDGRRLLNLSTLLILSLFVFSSCATTPGSEPQSVAGQDTNVSASHGSSDSANEGIPSVDVGRPASSILDSSPQETSFISDEKKPEGQGRGIIPSADQDSKGKKESFPSSNQPLDSVQQGSVRENTGDTRILSIQEEEGESDPVSLTEKVPDELKEKDRKAEITGVNPDDVFPVSDDLVQPENTVVSPSFLPGQSRHDGLGDNDATARVTPSNVPLGDVFSVEQTKEVKDGGLIDLGNEAPDVGEDVSIEDEDSSDSVVGVKTELLDEVDEPSLLSSSNDDTELNIDPRSSSDSSINEAETPGASVEEIIDSGRLIESGGGDDPASESPDASSRFIVFGNDDSIASDEAEQEAREIELLTEDSPNVSVSRNLVGESTGKRIVFGSREDVTPKRFAKRKIQFNSSERNPVLILRRPDSADENEWAEGEAEKSSERQFYRLKELFEKRSLDSVDSNFSASDQREFENIRELVESRKKKGAEDGNGKPRPNRYLNALEWLRTKGRE